MVSSLLVTFPMMLFPERSHTEVLENFNPARPFLDGFEKNPKEMKLKI